MTPPDRRGQQRAAHDEPPVFGEMVEPRLARARAGMRPARACSPRASRCRRSFVALRPVRPSDRCSPGTACPWRAAPAAASPRKSSRASGTVRCRSDELLGGRPLDRRRGADVAHRRVHLDRPLLRPRLALGLERRRQIEAEQRAAGVVDDRAAPTACRSTAAPRQARSPASGSARRRRGGSRAEGQRVAVAARAALEPGSRLAALRGAARRARTPPRERPAPPRAACSAPAPRRRDGSSSHSVAQRTARARKGRPRGRRRDRSPRGAASCPHGRARRRWWW